MTIDFPTAMTTRCTITGTAETAVARHRPVIAPAATLDRLLADTSATKVTMPFVEDNLAFVRELMGNDPWSYGVAPNRHVLDAFCAMHHSQGLSPRRLDVDELFHPSTLEQYRI